MAESPPTDQTRYHIGGNRKRVTTSAGFDPGNEAFSSHGHLTLPTINITAPGYIYVFVSNESENAEVWFDDLHINQVKSSIVAGADYYPFGLPMENRQATREKYRYGYQGQYSEIEGETNLLSFELRMYDARIGRWISPDPNGQYFSPYLAMGNAPHMIGDPTGGLDIPERILPAITVTATRIPLKAISTAALTALDVFMPKELGIRRSMQVHYEDHRSAIYKNLLEPVTDYIHGITLNLTAGVNLTHYQAADPDKVEFGRIYFGPIVQMLFGPQMPTNSGSKLVPMLRTTSGEVVAMEPSLMPTILNASRLPDQIHHFATNKHSYFTKEMLDIAKKYGLDLDQAWNQASMPHLGRHPTQYHIFVASAMDKAMLEAGPNKAKFLELFDKYVIQPVLENPELLDKSWWMVD